MAEIIVVGSYNQDLIFRTSRFPQPGETRSGEFSSCQGGKGFNQAVCAGRMRSDMLYLGAVGDDVFAAEVRAFCHGEGLSHVFQSIPEVATGVASIVVEDGGENQIIVAHGANALLDPHWLEGRMRENGLCKVVLCQNEVNTEATKLALRVGKELGATTLYNPAPMNAAIDRETLGLADVLLPNETEFLALYEKVTGASAEAELKERNWRNLHTACRKLGCPKVIITLGADGCFVSSDTSNQTFASEDGFFQHFEALPAKVVDTSGAGDSFCGAFAVGWVRFDEDLCKAIRFAMAAASIAVERRGTAPAMPHLDDVLRRLEGR